MLVQVLRLFRQQNENKLSLPMKSSFLLVTLNIPLMRLFLQLPVSSPQNISDP